MDIRKKAEPTDAAPTAPDNSVVDWLKANRHLLGPFNAGQLVQAKGDGTFAPAAAAGLPQESRDAVQKAMNEVKEASKVTADTPLSGVPVKKVPEPVNLDNLPADRKAAILEADRQAREKLQSLGLEQPQPQPPQPQQAANQLPNPGLPPDMQFDLDIAKFLDEERVAAEKIQLEAQSQQAAGDKEVPSSGALLPKTNCQHCGWDLNKEDPSQPDEMDKLAFLQAVLGQIPFCKSYELLGGRLQVVFRTLYSEEADMAFTQIAWDAGRGEILDEGQYFRTLTDYRLVLGLKHFKTIDGSVFNLPDSVHKWDTDKVPSKATKLVHIVPWMYENVLRSDSIRRAVATCFYRFQRMVESMEAHFDDPNFWPAIVEQR